MYQYYTMRSEFSCAVEELEREFSVPVRLVNYTHATSSRYRSWSAIGSAALPPLGFDITDADEYGITLVHFARPDGGSSRHSAYVENDNQLHAMYEVRDDAEELIYGASNIAVGEIDRENRVIWSYGPLEYCGEEWPEWQRAMLDAIRTLMSPDADAEERLAARAARQLEQAREALRNFARENMNQQIIARRNSIDEYVRKIALKRVQIAAEFRTLREEQQLLDALLIVAGEETGEAILRQYDELETHPRIASLSFERYSSTLVFVTTDDLRMVREDTGESRWLGAFRIEIRLSDMTIKLRNLNTRRGGRDHPHVVNETPCFGGAEDSMYELLGQGEIYAVVDLIIQYLETLNMRDSWGSYGSYWFDVPDERPLEIEVEEAIAA